MEFLNTFFIVVTLDVLNPLKSNEINDLHSLNKFSIEVTDEVFILLNIIEVNEEQFLNISPISVTLDVSNLDKSIFIIFTKLKNNFAQLSIGEFHFNIIAFSFLIK